MMSEKRAALEGMDFADAETRVPNEKPPLRFAPEESSLKENNKAEFALRDDAKAFLEGRRIRSRSLRREWGRTKLKCISFRVAR